MSHRLAFGVDIGGTNVRIVLGDDEGNILARLNERTETKKGSEGVSRQIIRMIRSIHVEGFKLEDYAESILQELPKENLERLLKYDDFVKAYESSPELNELLKEVGISKDYGSRGLKVNEWPSYGPCVKTMNEFTQAYLRFRERVIKLFKEISKEIGRL